MQNIIQFFQAILTLNGGFDWSEVRRYFFDSTIIEGAEITVILAVLAQSAGTLLGLIVYIVRRSRLRFIAEAYVWFFRGTPLLVQLLILFGLFPALHLVRAIRASDFFPSLGFPHVLLEAFLPALIAFSLNEGAYMSEIVRAGIDSIDVGQTEAAKSLGMTYGLSMRRIILPQAARVILPPLGNEFNNMLKTVSLAGAVGLADLYRATFDIGHTDFKVLELAFVASIWYLAMTTLWGFVQSYLERRFNASNTNTGSPQNLSWRERLLGGRFGGSTGGIANDIALGKGVR